MYIELEEIEELDSLKTTMNSRLQAACNRLLSEIQTDYARLNTSWGKVFTNAGETKNNRRKSDLRKSELRKPELRKSETHIGNATKCLNLLADYKDSLEKLEKKHTENFIESIRNELETLWDKCSYGEEQRKTFKPFYSETFTQEILAEHEEQLRILKQHFNSNKDLFKLVLKREKLWKEKVAFENPPDGCSRFENRGGTLIKELKRYQIVEKQLPITEKQIRSKIKSWEKTNKNIFLVKDSQYIKYIDLQKEEYKAEQEMKKKAKRLAKQEELAQEMLHGSNVAAKRTSFYDNTLFKTTNREINEETLTDLTKPTESSLIKSRTPLLSCGTHAEGLSKLSEMQVTSSKDVPAIKSRLPLRNSGSKISKMDISCVQKSPLKQKLVGNTFPSRISYKAISEEYLREMAKPTESSLLKSRLPLKNSRSENVFKRKGSLQTDARKRKIKRRSFVRLGESNRYFKENILEESYSDENGVCV